MCCLCEAVLNGMSNLQTIVDESPYSCSGFSPSKYNSAREGTRFDAFIGGKAYPRASTSTSSEQMSLFLGLLYIPTQHPVVCASKQEIPLAPLLQVPTFICLVCLVRTSVSDVWDSSMPERLYSPCFGLPSVDPCDDV